MLPSRRTPRWLVTAGGPVSLASIVAPQRGAIRRWVLETVSVCLDSGIGARFPLTKVWVEEVPGSTLLSVLADAVGLVDTRVSVAIGLGHWRAPRAIVLRAYSDTGETLAFAKLSLDTHGRSAVRAEAAGLAMAAQLRLRCIEAPTVLHAGRWEEQDLLVTSPVAGSVRKAPGTLPVRAMGELAEARGVRLEEIALTQWWVSLRRRIASVADPSMRARLDSVWQRIGACAGRQEVRLPTGCWHGDWTPWNMAWQEDRVALWDWEHAGAEAPVGFDHVHYLAQELRVRAGTGARAERRWLCAAAEVVGEHVGLDRRQQSLLLATYLLEVNVRYLLDRQSTLLRTEQRDGWGIDLLEVQANRLGEEGAA